MKDEESSVSAEPDLDQDEIDPSIGAGLGGFVIADQTALGHQPTEDTFPAPAARQDCEAQGGVGSCGDRRCRLETEFLDPSGESRPRVTVIHPKNTHPGESVQYSSQQDLRSGAFSRAGRVTATPSTHPKVSASRCRLRIRIRWPAS
jgi:hypothetical protein